MLKSQKPIIPPSFPISDASLELAQAWNRSISRLLEGNQDSTAHDEFFFLKFLLIFHAKYKKLWNDIRQIKTSFSFAIEFRYIDKSTLLFGCLHQLRLLKAFPEPLNFVKQLLSSCKTEVSSAAESQCTSFDISESDEQRALELLFLDTTASGEKEQLQLLTSCFLSFPQLRSFNVDVSILQSYAMSMIDGGSLNSAVKFVTLFKRQLYITMKPVLLTRAIGQKEWNCCATLICSGLNSEDEVKSGTMLDSEADFGDDVEKESETLTTTNITSSNSAMINDSHDNFDLAESDLADSMSTMTMTLSATSHTEGSDDERDVILAQLLGANDATALQAAEQIANFFKLKDWQIKIKIAQSNLKLTQYVIKNKWQMACQMIKNKSEAIKLFNILVSYGKYHEAQTVLKSFQLNGLVPMIEDSLIEEQRLLESSQYLAFPLPVSHICVVDSFATLALAKSILLAPFQPEEDIRFVGIDSEWFASARKPPLFPGASILQVSTSDQSFIFDMYAFASPRPMNLSSSGSGRKEGFSPLQEEARSILYSLFSNPRIIKVGWAFNNCDIDMLSKAGNGVFRDTFNDMHGFLELSNMVTDLRAVTNKSPLTKGKKRGMGLGLSDGCLELLGKPLNKGERMSNWDMRPLTESQCIYASLDAHSLLGILDRILTSIGARERSGAGDLYIDDEISQLLHSSKRVPIADITTEATVAPRAGGERLEVAVATEEVTIAAAAVNLAEPSQPKLHLWQTSWRTLFVKK